MATIISIILAPTSQYISDILEPKKEEHCFEGVDLPLTVKLFFI